MSGQPSGRPDGQPYSQMDGLLIYGAYGYTGALAARTAAARGQRPILAGRDGAKLQPLAAALGLEARIFALNDPAALDAGLEGVRAVLHCAGPFVRTAAPMVEACLRRQVHYLDITGEIPVFEALARHDAAAKAAGILVMPGAGFDVVPSDSLAVHLKRRLPSATQLTLAFQGTGGISHGTATTMWLHMERGGALRKGGQLVPVPAGSGRREIDFGRGPKLAVRIPWGDLATAWRSTGIPDIEVYMAAPRAQAYGMAALGRMLWLVKRPAVKRFVQNRIDRAPAGPTDEQRARARSFFWGEVRDPAGRTAVSRLETPEGYTHTVDASLALAERVLAGQAPTGYHTPGTAFGPDFVLGLPGVTRSDA